MVFVLVVVMIFCVGWYSLLRRERQEKKEKRREIFRPGGCATILLHRGEIALLSSGWLCRSFSQRILFKLWQRGVHLVPRVRVGRPNIHLRFEPTGIIQTRRPDRCDVRVYGGLGHDRRAAVSTKLPVSLATRMTG
jgi:hypothetical protein